MSCWTTVMKRSTGREEKFLTDLNFQCPNYCAINCFLSSWWQLKHSVELPAKFSSVVNRETVILKQSWTLSEHHFAHNLLLLFQVLALLFISISSQCNVGKCNTLYCLWIYGSGSNAPLSMSNGSQVNCSYMFDLVRDCFVTHVFDVITLSYWYCLY